MSYALKPKTVEEYIQSFPEQAREKLSEIRSILRGVAPNAKEDLKWGHPVLVERRILFSYSAYKTHLNFMPTGPTLDRFNDELTAYKRGKDTIQFPYDKPLPKALIEKLAQYRYHDVMENDAKWMY